MRRYRVEITDPAEAEIREAFLWWYERAPEFAGRWIVGIRNEIASLDMFPHRCPVARENDLLGTEIRRLLFGRRGHIYRILFRIVEPAEEQTEGLVRVLHVYHGSRQINEGFSD